MSMNSNNNFSDDEDLGVEDFEDVLNSYHQPKEAEGSQVPRHVGRTAARVGETLVGLPGDIREASKAVGGYLGEKARSFLGKDPLTDEQRQEVREMTKPSRYDLVGKLVETLPTSGNVREGITQKLTGEYLEPRGKAEEFGDEVASDFATLAIPIKGKIPFAKALGQSLFANSGSEVVKAFGGSDKASAATKMGLLFSWDLIRGKSGGIKKHINNLYKEMEAEVPKGAQVSAKNLSGKLDRLEATLRKGDPLDATKQPVFQKINAARDKINGGKIAVDEAIELNKSVNEAIFDSKGLKRSQNKLFDVRESIHDTIKEYGTENKDFLDKWKSANEAYAATETSRRLGNWVKKNMRVKDYVHAAEALGVTGLVTGVPVAGKAAVALGGAAATAYSAEIMKRIATSPSLRKYYLNVVSNAAKQNTAPFIRNVKMLDDGLKKSLEETPFENNELYETVEFDD